MCIPPLDFVARYTIKVIRSIQLPSGNRVNLCVRALDVHDLCYYVIWDRLYFFTKLSTSWDLSENLLITKLTFKVSARRLLWISFCIFLQFYVLVLLHSLFKNIEVIYHVCKSCKVFWQQTFFLHINSCKINAPAVQTKKLSQILLQS